MRDLVALALPGGPAFLDALLGAWDNGDAVAPLDVRLAPPAAAAVLDALAPSVVVGPDGSRRRRPRGRPVETEDALVVATSGTTGRARGVVLSHDALRASALATSQRLGVDPASDRWLACLPLAHVGGLSVVTRAVLTGTPLVIHPGFEARAVTEATSGDRPATLVSLVPAVMGRIDPSRFRRVVLGGSAPPSVLPANATTTYGLTETGSGVVYDGVPLDGMEVSLGPGSEIRLRGPMLFRAYRDGSDPRSADGWLATGDAGEWDHLGRLVVRGRLDDLIVTGGENVWPEAVESVLLEHPAVAETAVAGRPDPEWGQRVVAWVVPAKDAAGGPPTLDDLRQLVKQRLAPWAAPRQVVLVERLPRTSIGKLRRAALDDPGA